MNKTSSVDTCGPAACARPAARKPRPPRPSRPRAPAAPAADCRGCACRRSGRKGGSRQQRRRDGGRIRERDEPDRGRSRGDDAGARQGRLSRAGRQGENFIAYPVAQPVSTPPGKVEVVEGFWYGCGHCYALEPRLESWEKSKPDWIVLKRTPVIWNEVTREDARLFFTIESLGLLDKLHAEVFREIHANGHPLTVIRGGRVDLAATEKSAREFLMAKGVSAEDFAKYYRTFSAENKLRQAENLSRRYLLDHTPMFVVHGKYLTDATMAGGVDQLFQVVNDLAAREHEAG